MTVENRNSARKSGKNDIINELKDKVMNKNLENVIGTYLENLAKEDSIFAEAYKKENKSLSECCDYILSEALKNAQNNVCMADDATVYGWAVHYYVEDNLEIKKVRQVAHVSSCHLPSDKVVKTDSAKEEEKKPVKAEKTVKTAEQEKKPAKRKTENMNMLQFELFPDL